MMLNALHCLAFAPLRSISIFHYTIYVLFMHTNHLYVAFSLSAGASRSQYIQTPFPVNSFNPSSPPLRTSFFLCLLSSSSVSEGPSSFKAKSTAQIPDISFYYNVSQFHCNELYYFFLVVTK